MNIEVKTIDEFFQKSGAFENTLKQMDEFIQQQLPTLDRKLYTSDTICSLGYGEIPYKNTSYSGTLPILAIAPQKNNVSLYAMAWKDGQSLAETYSGRLGKTSNGKSCIRFKDFSNLNLDEFQNFFADVYQVYQSIMDKSK